MGAINHQRRWASSPERSKYHGALGHLGALSWENSSIAIAGMGSISFKMPFSDPSHSVKAFPTLDKGLPLGLVEKV